jgi:hypothetical protein
MSAEVIGAGLHCEELRQEVAKLAAGLGSLEQAFAAGRALERSQEQQASPPAPGRHAKPFKLLKGGSVAAFAGAAFTGLRHAWAVHPVATTAAGFTVATLAATTAVVAPHAAATFGVGGSPSAPAPAASIYSAVPVTGPSSQKLIAAVTGHKGSSRTLTLNMPPSLPSYAPQGPSAPSGGGGGQGPSQPSSQPVSVPDVRLVVTSGLDLGTGQSGTIRLAAFGGDLSWSASTSAGGLTLDSSSGTLQAGDSAEITVSIVADLQALAGPGSVTITYGDGKSTVVPVSWTVVPLPAPLPTDTSLPVPLPSLPVPGT